MMRMNSLKANLVYRGFIYFFLCTFFTIAGCDLSPRGEKPTGQETMRMSFDQLFAVNGNTVTPKAIIRIGATTFTPAVPFEIQVVTINNEPFSQYVGRDAEVRKTEDVYEVIRFY